MKINVHAGHNPDGKTACGAVGLIKESTEARAVKNLVISKLQSLDHTVFDCTCDNGTSQSNVLTNIVNACNAHTVDLDVSIHFNAGSGDKSGNGKTTGTEVYVYKSTSKAKAYAEKVCAAIAELGFKNRGVKTSTSLYYLKKTKAPAMLVECCFVDDADDVKLYNAEAMATAIVKGITGQVVSQTTTGTPYTVKITADVLDVMSGAGTSYKVTTTVKKNQVFTIVEEKDGWGRLKSGAGWISLKYTVKC